MAKLTQTQIDALITKLKKFPYAAAFGTDELGPLAGAPQIEGDVEIKDVTLYETGSDPAAKFITRNDVKVTIKTRNVDLAMTMLGGFAKGDNVLDTAKKKALVLVPITEATTEKTITFGSAFLQPGLSMTPGDNDDPSEVTLVFICKADATTGKPWTYAGA